MSCGVGVAFQLSDNYLITYVQQPYSYQYKDVNVYIVN